MNIKSANRIVFKLVSIILFIKISVFSLSAQSANWSQFTREVVINYSDSIVRAHILVNTAEVETFDHLMYYWYKQNQIFKNMGGYAGDLLQGEYLVFDKDRNLITKGSYESGLRHGTWKCWDSRGVIRKSVSYKNGLLHGDVTEYNEEGVFIKTTAYKDGIRQEDNNTGKMKIWKSNTDSIAETDTTLIPLDEE